MWPWCVLRSGGFELHVLCFRDPPSGHWFFLLLGLPRRFLLRLDRALRRDGALHLRHLFGRGGVGLQRVRGQHLLCRVGGNRLRAMPRKFVFVHRL